MAFVLCVPAIARAEDPPVGQVVVVSDPPGAIIKVDGAAVGPSPAEAKVLPGEHLVEAIWDDGSKITKTVTVEAGKSVLVQLVRPAAEVAPTPTEPPEQTPDATGGAVGDAAPHVIPGEVLNPLHPRLRRTSGHFLQSIQVGRLGTSFDSWSNGSSNDFGGGIWQLRTNFYEWTHVDLHVKGVLSTGDSWGIMLGSGFGTAFGTLGSNTTRVAMAFRIDVDAAVLKSDRFLDGSQGVHYGVVIMPGMNLSIALSHSYTLEFRLAAGGFLGSAPGAIAEVSLGLWR